MPEITASQWEEFTSQNPGVHLLQTRAWGDLKTAFGWRAIPITVGSNGVQILIRRTFPGINMAYIPKGPGDNSWETLAPEVIGFCKHLKVAFLKIEPDLWEGLGKPTKPYRGFITSPHSIQPLRTSIIRLDGDENSILSRMKQKTRYNINLALRKGVVVRAFTDIKLFHDLMEITGERDQFGVHNLSYYQMAYDLFHSRGGCELFLAQFDNEPLAALMVFAQGNRAWYLYGGSTNLHRDRMPNYLLQWEAMRWARMMGCTEYDLWGIPDEDELILEEKFLTRGDGLWGVYRFKRGFGGEVRRGIGPWDFVFNPILYKLYRLWLQVCKNET